jgi:transcriptional repressor NrdR
MKCPFCDSNDTKVVDTRHDTQGNVRRRRECSDCEQRFSTIERAILTNPLVVKRDGRREEFDPDKLMSGLRIACTRRPISAEALEGIVERVAYEIRQTGRTEISSQTIGDLVIEELRRLDEVAYIRYAIVYMGLRDLESIRAEIDRLRVQRV